MTLQPFMDLFPSNETVLGFLIIAVPTAIYLWLYYRKGKKNG